MSAPRVLGILCAAGLAVTALAGCAPDPQPTTPPPAAPSATPAADPAPASPVSGLPLGCADLLSTGFVQDHVQGDTISAVVSDETSPVGIDAVTVRQAGALDCIWGGSGRTDGGYDISVHLTVLPDAGADYDAWSAGDRPAVDWVDDTLGDRSSTHCEAAGYSTCYGGILVGGYWIDVVTTDSSDLDAAGARANFDELIAPVATAVGGAGGPRTLWEPPADAFDPSALCDEGELASTVLGAGTTIEHFGDSYTGAANAGAYRVGQSGCAWHSTAAAPRDLLGVRYLPGGAWAFDQLAANPQNHLSASQGDFHAIDIPGADGVLISEGDGVVALISYRGSLISAYTGSTYESDDIEPVIADLVAALDAGSAG